MSKEYRPLEGHSGQLNEKCGRGRNTWKYITMLMGGEQGAMCWFFYEFERSMSSLRVPYKY